MRKEKKTVYTLNVDNYAPEISEITFPYIKKWADKIGADFFVIKDRKFPNAPVTYEKFQIYELSKEHNNDWNIFLDADALIHPDFFDITSILPKDMTVSNGTDFVPHRFTPNEYHKRDGRFIGKGNWIGIFSDWCRDYYRPLDSDVDIDEIVSGIYPTLQETNFGITPCHLIDDYTVSNNIARFGLKHTIIPQLNTFLDTKDHNGFTCMQQGLLAHQYLMPTDQKVIYFHKTLKQWGIN